MLKRPSSVFLQGASMTFWSSLQKMRKTRKTKTGYFEVLFSITPVQKLKTPMSHTFLESSGCQLSHGVTHLGSTITISECPVMLVSEHKKLWWRQIKKFDATVFGHGLFKYLASYYPKFLGMMTFKSFGVPEPSKVRWSWKVFKEIGVFRPEIWMKSQLFHGI